MPSFPIQRREDAQQLVWKGAIPLQIHLHESQVTTLPPPPPFHILAPRIGYLPLLVPQIKPHFDNPLPPGVDTIWFDYKGLPLKWFIPTGVLFDLLCAELQRPWNLTLSTPFGTSLLMYSSCCDFFKSHRHPRAFKILSQKPWVMLSNFHPMLQFDDFPGVWFLLGLDFKNRLRFNAERVKRCFLVCCPAAYIINGNCRSVMNTSQADQHHLWHSVLNGDLEAYLLVSTKRRLSMEEGQTVNMDLVSTKPDNEISGQVKTGKIPIRLYVRCATENFDDLDEVPRLDNWDRLHYINQPVDICKDEGKYFILGDAIGALLPEVFAKNTMANEGEDEAEVEEQREAVTIPGEQVRRRETRVCQSGSAADLKLLRIQGIEPRPDIPFSWVADNLVAPGAVPSHIRVNQSCPRKYYMN